MLLPLRSVLRNVSRSTVTAGLVGAAILVMIARAGAAAAPPATSPTTSPVTSAAGSVATSATASPAETSPLSSVTDASASPFEIKEFPKATIVYCASTATRVEFWRDSGRFRIAGPGDGALEWAYPIFRSDGTTYRFPTGLDLKSETTESGVDSVAPYAEVEAVWQAHDPAHTEIRTSGRLYAGIPAVVFQESFPHGARAVDGAGFGDVGCAFPVFDSPQPAPLTLHWLSYTYQDWPIPIRGEGWPDRLALEQWPAARTDDGIRTPLALFNPEGETVILSPVDHPLQQLTVVKDLTALKPPTEKHTPGDSLARQEPRPPTAVAARNEPHPSTEHRHDGDPAAPDAHPSGSSATLHPSPPDSSSGHREPDSTDASSSEPTLAVPGPPSILTGPEGSLADLPAGAEFRSVVYFGRSGVVETMLQWGHLLQRINGKQSRPAPDDLTARTLGYWTDNGSAYYYRTEGNASYQAMLAAIRAYHVENHIPIQYYQLDSWWYSKGRDGGTALWSPSAAVLPDGVAGIHRLLDGMPLALHNRYWSEDTPYQKAGGFAVGQGSSVPLVESFYDGLFKTVSGWGCRLYEQDWLAPQFRKVDVLQSRYGAAAEWLKSMDGASARWDLPIQFCMPSMGFYLASTGMPGVTQIRTSRDFDRSRWDSVRLRWMEDAQLSLPAAALGLAPSKDVLMTTPNGGVQAKLWEQTEALLAILSRGPVGIGDAFGHTDPALVRQFCTEDGALVQPDAPAVPVDASVIGEADAKGLPLVIQTGSTVDGRSWRYALAMDLGDTRLLGENPWLGKPPLTVVASTAPTHGGTTPGAGSGTGSGTGTEKTPGHDGVKPAGNSKATSHGGAAGDQGARKSASPAHPPAGPANTPSPAATSDRTLPPAAPLPPPRPTANTDLLGTLEGPFVCYDYFGQQVLGVVRPGEPVNLDVADLQPGYTILAPLFPNGMALLGDIGKFVTVSRSRFSSIKATARGFDLQLQGPVGSDVTLAVYSPAGSPFLTVEESAAGRRAHAPAPLAGEGFGLWPYQLWRYHFHLPAAAVHVTLRLAADADR